MSETMQIVLQVAGSVAGAYAAVRYELGYLKAKIESHEQQLRDLWREVKAK